MLGQLLASFLGVVDVESPDEVPGTRLGREPHEGHLALARVHGLGHLLDGLLPVDRAGLLRRRGPGASLLPRSFESFLLTISMASDAAGEGGK